jgi:hypothetical protein
MRLFAGMAKELFDAVLFSTLCVAVLGPVAFFGYCIGFLLKAFMAYQIPFK